MIKKLLPLLFLFVGFQANAALVFTYELNTSDWDITVQLTDGDTLSFSFLDGTDLYNISSADIYSYTYDLAAGSTGTNYKGAGWASEVGNIGTHFSWDGTHLDLTFNNLGGDFITQTDDTGYNSHIATGQTNHVYSNYSGGNMSAELVGNDASLTLSAVLTVPEPSIIALFGLGLVGIGFACRRSREPKSFAF
jgi:hypothetical protein